MVKLRELKTLMLCMFVVAVASLIMMFYYAVNYTRYTKLERTFVVVLHDNTPWNSSNNSKGQRSNNQLTHQVAEGLVINRNQQEQNIHQKRSNIDAYGANLASRNKSDLVRGLCPETSKTLGKSCVPFFLVLICCFHCVSQKVVCSLCVICSCI